MWEILDILVSKFWLLLSIFVLSAVVSYLFWRAILFRQFRGQAFEHRVFAVISCIPPAERTRENIIQYLILHQVKPYTDAIRVVDEYLRVVAEYRARQERNS